MRRWLITFLAVLLPFPSVWAESQRALSAFAALAEPRALAVAGDGALAYGLGYGTLGDSGAAVMALEACNAARKRFAMRHRCEITRLNDRRITRGAELRRRHAGGMLPLWHVRRGDREMFLAGSIHLLKATLHPLDPGWQRAFDASDALVVEIDPARLVSGDARTKLASMTRLPNGVGLDDILPADTSGVLTRYLASQGSTISSFASTTPIWLATQIQLNTFTALGYLPQFGLEAQFLPLARKRGLEVVELESVDEQLDALLGYDMPVQIAVLQDTLTSLDEAPELIEDLTAAWLQGDADAFMRLFERQNGDSPTAEAYADALIEARNRRMTERLLPMLSSPAVEFVLVGTAHMGGANGLIAALHGAGAEIEQLERSGSRRSGQRALQQGL